MNTKKVLQMLVKIADNQQKIINKLAQGLPPDALPNSQISMTESPDRTVNPEPPPTSLQYNKPSTFQSAIALNMPDNAKENIPMPMGLSIEDGTLFWFTRNQLPQDQLISLQKDITNAVAKVKQGHQFPELNQVSQVRYRAPQQPVWQVGK